MRSALRRRFNRATFALCGILSVRGQLAVAGMRGNPWQQERKPGLHQISSVKRIICSGGVGAILDGNLRSAQFVLMLVVLCEIAARVCVTRPSKKCRLGNWCCASHSKKLKSTAFLSSTLIPENSCEPLKVDASVWRLGVNSMANR
jgi:hypothetical protein